jgi:hypothetical protein
MSTKHPKRTELAKFICKEIMDDDWGLGKRLCLGYADEILAMLAAPELLDAAQTVMAGLNHRIKTARDLTPVFDGIADLHDAIGKAGGKQS